ncbi:hypothetical protein K402DRAFT_459954, partial [Aulographum hederae CBS 113979]
MTASESSCDTSGICNVDQGARISIFSAIFHTVSITARQPQDVWGNINIPYLGATVDQTADEWLHIPPRAEPQYVALLGIPFAKPEGTGNMTFVMQSWYWHIENATLWENCSTASLLTPRFNHTGSPPLTNLTHSNRMWQFAIPEKLDLEAVGSIPITFEIATEPSHPNADNRDYAFKACNGLPDSAFDGHVARLDAMLTPRPVELN